MEFEMKYDIYAEAKAVLEMRSPLHTFTPKDIGTFVLAWSGKDATAAIRGTLMRYGCDSDGEYAMVKAWSSGEIIRYTLVAKLPYEMMPNDTIETKGTLFRDPNVKQPEMPL